MTILIISDHDNKELNPATLTTITAGLVVEASVDVLVAGHNAQVVATQVSTLKGVWRVILVDSPIYEHHLAENVSTLVASMADGYSHVFAPATLSGKAVIPRASALKDCQAISDIVEVVDAKTFKRPIYAGNAIATVQSNDAIVFATVRTTAFDVAIVGGNALVDSVSPLVDTNLTQFVSAEIVKSDRPELTTAGIVISGGRGIGSAENFSLLEDVADKLGAAVGGSRAAVDSGFCPNNYQIGQTGKVVAPNLYIAVGISGAIQHLAGMKDSKVIVAINNDKDAPIFQVADYGLEEDLFTAIPAFKSAL